MWKKIQMGQMMKYFYDCKKRLLYYRESGKEKNNLPLQVYAYIIPDMGHQFILHIILSLGRFETEVDMKMHRRLRDYLRYSKLIGTDDDKESLKQYLGSFLWHFIEERLVHYPNAFKERDIFKINTAYICDVVIIYDVIQIADMPPVLHTKIFQSHDEAVVIFWYKTNGI